MQKYIFYFIIKNCYIIIPKKIITITYTKILHKYSAHARVCVCVCVCVCVQTKPLLI